MSKEELLERARVWLELPYPRNRDEANRRELNTLYTAITGKVADCTSCTNWLIRMAAKLTDYTVHHDLYTLPPTKKETMANKSSKYQIAKGAAVTQVVLNHGTTSELVDLRNMTDAQAERIAKHPRYKHNVELIKTKATADDKTASKKPAPKAAKAEAPAKAEETDTAKE